MLGFGERESADGNSRILIVRKEMADRVLEARRLLTDNYTLGEHNIVDISVDGFTEDELSVAGGMTPYRIKTTEVFQPKPHHLLSKLSELASASRQYVPHLNMPHPHLPRPSFPLRHTG